MSMKPIADELAEYLQAHREKRVGPPTPPPQPQWEEEPQEAPEQVDET